MATDAAARGFGMVLVLTALVVSGCSSGGSARTDPVRLEVATAQDQYPWTGLLLPAQVPVVVPPPDDADVSGTGDPVAVTDDGTAAVAGDRTALYGGSLNRELCDRQELVDTLEQDPAKIEAWLGVLKVTDAREYVRKLTPVLLRADTRVTMHEYRSGNVVAVQSVLESGTVVLVDDRGTPKVRCARGTPLTAPVLTPAPDLTGDGWDGLDPERLFVVQPAATSVPQLTVVDISTGALLPVPIGAGPQQPAPAPPPEAAVASPAPRPDNRAPEGTAPVPRPQSQAPAPPPPPPPPPEPPPPLPPPPPPPPPAPAPAPVPVPPAPEPAPQIQIQIPGAPPVVIPLPF
ncbi:DUF6777 domain-containing protein [Rhodococcus zopfii]|uniref:DUF6777 domain-containing protein n=1 Tax=Rhodococcus zopfii TaxID=43772 RepID=UPI0036690A06